MSVGVAEMWRMQASPAASSRCAVAGPTPGSHLLGSGWMNRTSNPASTSRNAAGLDSLDAIWLTSLLLAMPSLTEILSDCRMAVRMVSATFSGGLRTPLRSK